MTIDPLTIDSILAENAELRSRLDDAEETLRALRSGEVDALIIGDQIYSLESSDAASNRFRGEVLSQMNEVVIAVDQEMRVTYLNPAAEDQYGIASDAALGCLLADFITIGWPEPHLEAEATAALATDGFWHGENIHIKRDGESIYVESNVTRLVDDKGEPNGLLAVIRDVTSRKHVEKQLYEAHDELERRVEERTRDLARTSAVLQKEIEDRALAEKHRSNLLQRVVTIQEEERRRIARDIHDQLGQRVTALRFQIASLFNDVEAYRDPVPRLEELKDTARKLDTDVSFLAWELRPASLDDLGLEQATKSFLDEWSAHHQISVEFDSRGPALNPLDPQAETHLYRILQESLNNIVKHAKASRVTVLIQRNAEGLVLIVEDDGRGFEPDVIDEEREVSKGLGLLGMKERAILVGGEVQIESKPGKGTTVHVRIPWAIGSDVSASSRF
jgi:PAS domain S-box-containing protein